MAISASPVQQQSCVSSGASIAITLASTPIQGNTLVLFVGNNVITTVISSISQAGVTWTLGKNSNNGSNRASEIWYGTVGASPSTSITVTLSNTPAGTFRGGISEWSGIDTGSPLGATGSRSDTTATPTTATITPTAGREALLFATARVTGNATLPTGGFTALTTFDASCPASYLVVNPTTGSYSTSWTATAGNSEMEIITLFAPSGAVANSNFLSFM